METPNPSIAQKSGVRCRLSRPSLSKTTEPSSGVLQRRSLSHSFRLRVSRPAMAVLLVVFLTVLSHLTAVSAMGIGGGFASSKKRPLKGPVAAFPAYGDRDATLALHGPMETFTTRINVAIYDPASKTLKYAKRPFRAHVYYVPLKMGSKQQRFLAQVDMLFSSLWVPCDCISCAKGRPEVPKDTPFDSLSSYSVQYLSCSDPRCVSVGVSEFNTPLVGCNDPGKTNPYVNTSLIPGNDPLCVYTTPLGVNSYDLFTYDNTTILFANASDPSIGPLDSAGHVIADTLFFPEDPATAAAAAAVDAAAKAAAEAEAEAKAVEEAIAIAVAYGVISPAPASSAAPAPAAAAAPPPPPPLSNRTIFFGCGSAQSGWWGQQDTWVPNGVVGLGPFSPLLKQVANESMSFAMCLEKPRPWVENVTRWNQNNLELQVVPVERFDGGSHLMVGPVDFPANASRTEIYSFDGLYIPVILNTSYSMGNRILVNHPKANEDVNVIAFSSTIFTHFLKFDLVQAILTELGFANAFDSMTVNNTTLACFRSNKDPFTTFPSIRIGFVEGSEFVVPPSGYVAQVGDKEYCFLCHVGEDIDIWAAPALYDKQIYINYPNKTFAWIDTPQCSKNLSFVPPPPSPPAPAVPKPGARLAALPSLSWHLVTTGSLLVLLLLPLLPV